ncbi:Gfo/Idh/MocA family protein [Nocardia sp. NPDC003963]
MITRIGVLGAAAITPAAVLAPAASTADIEVVAIAARDPERARHFADKHGIPVVHDSYAEMVDDPGIDAIYNPLPIALHGMWTRTAVAAGKHVLVEKPFAANAFEAQAVAAVAAQRHDRVVMEGMHYRYHPVAEKAVAIVRSGELGEILSIEAWMCTPNPPNRNPRWQYALGGGALMEVGCYPVHLSRTLGGEPRVTAAQAVLHTPQVDRSIRADMEFPNGATGRLTASMWSHRLLAIGARVLGTDGELRISNPFAPMLWNRISVRHGARWRHERLTRQHTYLFQLAAFVDSVRTGSQIPTDPADGVANMVVMDAIYRAAGLPIRQPAESGA